MKPSRNTETNFTKRIVSNRFNQLLKREWLEGYHEPSANCEPIRLTHLWRPGPHWSVQRTKSCILRIRIALAYCRILWWSGQNRSSLQRIGMSYGGWRGQSLAYAIEAQLTDGRWYNLRSRLCYLYRSEWGVKRREDGPLHWACRWKMWSRTAAMSDLNRLEVSTEHSN